MKTFCATVFLATICLGATPAVAAAPVSPLVLAAQESHVVLDDLNVLLLYSARTGQAIDPLELVEITDGKASDDVHRALLRYRESKDPRERFERKTVLEFTVKDRQDRLGNADAYVIPLASTIGAFDPVRKLFPLQLRLDVAGRDGRAGQQCLQPYLLRGVNVQACLSSDSLASGDPIFTTLPVENAASAALISQRHRQGSLQLYGLARDTADPATTSDGSSASGALRRWTQPLTITGLLLVDAATNQLLGAAKTHDSGVPGAAPVAAPGTGVPPGLPGSTGTTLATQPGTRPPGGGEQGAPEAGPLAPPRTGTPAAPERADAVVPQMDRLLSFLALAVYSDGHKYTQAARDIEDIEAKIARIEADAGRPETIRARELRQLALALESRQRALARHADMLERKETVPATYGLIQVESDRSMRTDKVYHEHYRRKDGLHIIVFRGTDNMSDFETDFQQATTPEMLGELADKFRADGDAGMTGALGRWMQQRADKQVSSNPAAFHLADALVAALAKTGVKPSNIILAGHSLGGGLAQFAGLRNSVGQVVTFNPAPLSPRQIELLQGRLNQQQTVTRNYIGFVPSRTGTGGTYDPVSRALADLTTLNNPSSLRVFGDQHVVTVCNDLASEAYQSFSNKAQGLVTNLTVKAMATGRGELAKGGAVLGGTVGGTQAGTDRGSAILHGTVSGYKTGGRIAAGINCLRRPFLCSAVAAGGGLASVAVRAKLPDLWAYYSAHSMKRMHEALNGEVAPYCSTSEFTPAPAEDEVALGSDTGGS